jgi:hypothetical protein
MGKINILFKVKILLISIGSVDAINKSESNDIRL